MNAPRLNNPRVLLLSKSGPRRAPYNRLQEAGYDVLVEANETHALQRISHDTVDALIYEVHDCRHQALPFLEQLQQLESDPCVILVGPGQGAEHAASLLRAGAFDYLTLPLRPGRLEDSLRQGLKIRRSLIEVRKLSGKLRKVNGDLARERDSLQQWNQNLLLVNQLGQELAGTLHAEEIVNLLGTRLAQMLAFKLLGVMWLQPEKVWVHAPGMEKGHRLEQTRQAFLARGRGLRFTADERQSYNSNMSHSAMRPCDQDVIPGREPPNDVDTDGRVAVIELPLMAAKRLVGLIRVECAPGAPFEPSQVELVKTIATSLALALRNAEVHNYVQNLAITDGLTNLLNRRAFSNIFTREFREAERYCTPLCLVMADIDHFKKVNDKFGHMVGDRLLTELAGVITRSARAVDVITRYGGEEFALILPRTDLPQASIMANRIRVAVERHPFEINGSTIRLTISLGIARIPHPHIVTADEAVASSDAALYRAKSRGRNRVEVDQDGVGAGSDAQLSLPASAAPAQSGIKC